MELKYKNQRIRDLFVYYTNIRPVKVDIKRHEVIIYIKEVDFKEDSPTKEVINGTMSVLLGRKTTLKVVT